MLLNLLLYGTRQSASQNYLTDHVDAECAYYPVCKTLAVINNSANQITTNIQTDHGSIRFTLDGYETQFAEISS